MRIINKDLTKECVQMFVTGNQIYARIWSKNSHKWELSEYFKDYSFEVDSELVESTIRYIVKLFGLKNPKIIIE